MASASTLPVPFSSLEAESRRRVVISVAWRALGAILIAFAIAMGIETVLGLVLALAGVLAYGGAVPVGAVSLLVVALVGAAALYVGAILSLRLFLRWSLRSVHAGYRLRLFQLQSYGADADIREVDIRSIPQPIRSYLFWRWSARLLIGVVFGITGQQMSAWLPLIVVLLILPVALAQWLLEAEPPDAEFLFVPSVNPNAAA